MAVYHGSLNVISDGQGGAVIAVTLNPTDIPADGLDIDISGLQTPAGQQFGNILGLTVDANSTNVTSGLISISFAGGSNLTRAANGGTTQVFKVLGQCKRITLNNLAWSTGPINVVLWNTTPSNELVSAVNVQATITAGSITFTNSSIQIDHAATTISFANQNNPTNGTQFAVVPNVFNGTIRSIDIQASNIQAFKSPGLISVILLNQFSVQYYQNVFGVTPENQNVVEVTSLSVLAVPFTRGINAFVSFNPTTMVVNNTWSLNVTIGWN